MGIRNDMGSIQEFRMLETADGASAGVGIENELPKRRLVHSLTSDTGNIAPDT
jgi:hypothetical protein